LDDSRTQTAAYTRPPSLFRDDDTLQLCRGLKPCSDRFSYGKSNHIKPLIAGLLLCHQQTSSQS
jgi:hypothetical protein